MSKRLTHLAAGRPARPQARRCRPTMLEIGAEEQSPAEAEDDQREADARATGAFWLRLLQHAVVLALVAAAAVAATLD